ncbi:1-acyl-sn-glycerol-3-phosphate acyltransferase [Tateyamaria omphalii]|uniref:lysophospholipid acyltransferase family protein n=1 Tax=Tateyamaria omphalii TaxID=299262 RepID=UPI001C99260B|nr:lysophospholipid acyltransferase family protein [Tateyamaria omphalii]MBY5933834.1 1-acyl-sn-glycerol-3-phosphate acyltransferase [Tateyamaria omphalii]
MQMIRSALFVGQIYVAMLVLGIVFAPYAIVSRNGAYAACKTYCKWVFWTMGWMVGIKGEVRGDVPQGEVLIASKHQSFLDIMLIFHALPAAKFIMKRELLYAPIIGIYAKRLGCVPVARGKRGAAIAKMVADVEAGRAHPGQLIIYSQGTRVAPGAKVPYKVGTAVLYQQLGQPCVPVATNVGLFWPRKGISRRPGTAVVEFLPEMLEGMSKDEFMAQLESTVEARSDALMREGGFEPNGVH